MRSLIISIFLLFVLVVTPKHVFAEPLPGFPHIEVADVFYAPMFNDTGLFGAFGGYFGGNSGSQLVDWSIGNTIPHSGSMTDAIVFSTSLGNFMNPANWFERMRITKDGNVGIGTASPDTPLHVLSLDNTESGNALIEGTGPAGDIRNTLMLRSNHATSNSSRIMFQDNDNDLWEITNDLTMDGSQNFYIHDVTVPATRFLIDSAGNVGIGTTSPLAPFHVDASVSWPILPLLSDNSVDNRTGAGIRMRKSRGTPASKTIVNNGDALGAVHFFGYDGSAYQSASSFVGRVDGTPSSGNMPGRLEFKTNDGTGLFERMRIDNSGNVGIGTTSPQGALDVSSTTGGFIVPRMTTTQRNALTAVNGMIIYNITTNAFNFYENGAWVTK